MFLGCEAYIQYRVRVLRWDSACFQGTKSLHVPEPQEATKRREILTSAKACQAAYWCFPLGLLAAAWERSWKAVPKNDLFTGWYLGFAWPLASSTQNACSVTKARLYRAS